MSSQSSLETLSLGGEEMFDLGKLGDLSKMASQAKQIQEKQEAFARQQIELLEKISKQLEQVISLLKNRAC